MVRKEGPKVEEMHEEQSDPVEFDELFGGLESTSD